MSLFDEVLSETDIEIDCPDCEKSFDIQLNQVGTTVTCPHCGAEIKLEADREFLSGAEEALDELEDTLDNLK